MSVPEIQGIVNSNDQDIMPNDVESISALALDGDLPDAFLDLPLSPTDREVNKLWRGIRTQASIQRGERQVKRRGPMQIKSSHPRNAVLV